MRMGLICKLWGHQVNRRRIWDDGISPRGRCKHCNISMIRDDGMWRPFDPELDFDAHRRPNPRFTQPPASA